MSRMFLYFDKPRQPSGNETATYPIYELDLQGLADAGMVSWDLSGQVTNAVNECWHVSGSVNNANVSRYLSTNVPHQQWQDGSILQAKISKYVLNENNVYVPDPEYYDFEEVPIGQQPDDWGTASNYLRYEVTSNATIDGQTATYRAYYNIRRIATWISDWQYVRDKRRSMIRLFYTENGYNFGVYQGADCNGYDEAGPVFNAAGYSQMSRDFSNPIPTYYTWCNPSENLLYVGGNNVRILSPCWSRTDSAEDKGKMIAGREISAATFFIFVHGVYDGKDYYGVLCIYPQDFSETATFKQISFSLFTSEFWGDSIIAGGGGESVWGNDGPTSIPQGGNGSFSYIPNNHGDRQGEDIGALITRTNSNMTAFSGGYHKYKMDRQNQAPLTEMMGRLWDPDVWDSWKNHNQNPLAAIVSCMMLPVNLVSNTAGVAEVIKAADAELSSTAAPKFDDIFKWYHVGDVNIDSYTDSFADFQATNVYIHLPYVGDFKLDTEAIMEGELSVDYVVDMFTADITAWVWTKDKFGNYNYKYEFKGNCGKVMPLAQIVGAGAQRLGAIFNTIVDVGLQTVPIADFWKNYKTAKSISSEGFFNTLSGAIQATQEDSPIGQTYRAQSLSRGITSILGASAAIGQSNAGGGSLTSLINDQCYLTITRPQWSAPENYRKLFGYPSDIGGTIEENFEGYLSVRAIKLDGLSATDAEKAEITSLMYSGVYVSDNFGPED